MYDALIVGARCGGAATALLLAQRGYRVLLVDRATFPSDTISGHFILHSGVQKLAEWGVLERVMNAGTPPVNRWTMDIGDFPLSAEVQTDDGLPACIGPRRTVLDALLVDAAVAAGAELREGFTVTDLVCDDGLVTGVRGQTRQGTRIEEHARIVIGADGKRSTVARLVQAERYREVDTLTCWYLSYWRAFPVAGLEINWRPRRAVFAFPTNDGLTSIAVAWKREELHQFRADVEGNYEATITMMSSLQERLAGAQRVERIVGMADLPNFFHKPFGPGWALIGDAGHHKDPLLARGMSDAFSDAALLVDAIDAGFSGREPLLAALARYEQLRNERAIPDNDANLQAAQLLGWDTPDALRLRAALRVSPDDASHFFATRSQVRPAASFFAPENLARIIAQTEDQAVLR